MSTDGMAGWVASPDSSGPGQAISLFLEPFLSLVLLRVMFRRIRRILGPGGRFKDLSSQFRESLDGSRQHDGMGSQQLAAARLDDLDLSTSQSLAA